MRQVVGQDLAHPVVAMVAVEAADHLAERADVSAAGQRHQDDQTTDAWPGEVRPLCNRILIAA
jgi:hypothetical protein